MNRRTLNIRFFSILLLVLSLIVVFSSLSCIDVHNNRIKVYCIYNESGSREPSQKAIELIKNYGSMLDLDEIGFSRIQYMKMPSCYGYRDGEKAFKLREGVGISGDTGCVFEIEQTGLYYVTSDPLNFVNVNLYPVYDDITQESEEAMIRSKPGVEIIYSYNDAFNVEEVKHVSRVYSFTTSDIRSGVTLDAIGFYPRELDGIKAWDAYDYMVEDASFDRLFYGYVDTNDHNKAYYFNKEFSELENKTDYHFVDKNGKIYSTTTPLDVNSFTTLYPLYVNAGYRQSVDYFGVNSDNEDINLNLVFLPGTYNNPWPYEGAGVNIGNSVNQVFFAIPKKSNEFPNVGGYEPKVYFDYMTNGFDHSTQDMLVCDIILPQGFVYDILQKDYVDVRTENNTTIVTLQNPDNPEAPGDEYTFSSEAIMSTDYGLYDAVGHGSTIIAHPYLPWGYVKFGDAIVMANLMTEIYNRENPNKPSLDPVYWTCPIVQGGSVVKSFSDGAGLNLYTDPSAKGYRLPKNHEFSYWARVILDDRLIPNNGGFPIGRDGSVGASPLILKSSLIGTKYSYRSVYDYDYMRDPEGILNNAYGLYLGSAAGLSRYNTETKTYDSNPLDARRGNKSYSETDPGSVERATKVTTQYPTDLVVRNGAGLYYLYGLRNQWVDAWADCGKDSSDSKYSMRIARGGRSFIHDTNTLEDNSNVEENAELRIPCVVAVEPNSFPDKPDGSNGTDCAKNSSVRFCRYI